MITVEDYQETLHRIESLMDLDPSPDSAAGQELLKLVSQVEAYEERFYPITRVLPSILIK